MKNARIIKEIIDNNVITKLETIPVGASIARPQTPKNDLNNKHNQTGITLIALVITIILLLILASITINLTLGERGIFNTAKKAVENYKSAEERESLELNNFEQETYNTINGLENDSIIIKQPVTSIKIEPENIKLKIGEKKTITATIEPANATNKSIEWKSGNTDIVEVGKQTINADGTVTIEMTGVGEGTTTIIAKSKYGEYGKEVVGSSAIKVQPNELVVFDYQKGGAQFELAPIDNNSYNSPNIKTDAIYGFATVKGEGWNHIGTIKKFDLTNYDYMYFEGIFARKHYSFSEFAVGRIIFCTDYNMYPETYKAPVPLCTQYTGFYYDISGNTWNDVQITISPKMSGDSVRLLKFTSDKPEGTYIGALNN